MILEHRLLPLFVLASTAAIGRAQHIETFDGGSNEGTYVIWFNAYNTLQPTGGNPGATLQLDNFTSGPATCDHLEIQPTSWPSTFSGDHRALGITFVGIDVNTLRGLYGGTFEAILTSDPGTPGNTADDTSVSFLHLSSGPLAAGWVSYDFVVDSASTTLPAGRAVSGPLVATPDIAWNTVITDVDKLGFKLDALPQSFCVFTDWIFRVDNIRAGIMPNQPFCAGEGLDALVTTACPCLNFGAVGHGCANSVNASGALLAATGYGALDNVVLQGSAMPATVSCIYLQGDGLTDQIFGDGVRRTGGTLLRLRTRANVGGASQFPDSTDAVTLSQRGGVTVGSGATRYFQTYYRNSSAAFCPPETFNVTNGQIVVW